MSVWKNKDFYIRTLVTFAVIVLLDWFIESGFKLFQGRSLGQTFEQYRIPFTYLGVAAAIVYSNLAKKP